MALITGTITRANIDTKLTEEGVREVFFNQYDLVPGVYEKIYKTGPSKKKTETNVMMSGVSTWALTAEGNSPDFDSIQEAWNKSFTHVKYAKGVELTEEAQEDDLYDVFMDLVGQMGETARYTREVNAMDLFNSLSATVYTAGGSNFTLLSTSQFRADGGSWSNRPTVAADLSNESLEALLTQWSNGMLNNRGLKQVIKVKYLMVGPSDKWIAKRILMSDKRQGTADNDINTFQDEDIQLLVNPHMTDDGRWFLIADPSQTQLRFYDRAPVTMRRRDDPRTGNLLHIGRYRASWGAYGVYGLMGSP